MRITTSPERGEWGRFIKSNENGTVFQTPEMADVFDKSKNHKSLVFAALNDSDEIVGLMAGDLNRIGPAVGGSFSSRCVVQAGPIIGHDAKDEVIEDLLSEFNRKVKKRALYSQIRNSWNTASWKKSFVKSGFEYEEHLNILVDTNKSVDELYKNLNRKRRNGVSRAKRRGVTVRNAKTNRDVIAGYDCLVSTYTRAKLPLANLSLFEQAFKLLRKKDMITVLLAEQDKDIIASMFLLKYRGTVHDWYAGAKDGYSSLCPNDILAWSAIELCANEGRGVFDFGGAGKPDKPYGVRDFKKQFGGRVVNYGRYENIYSKTKFKIAEKTFNVMKRLKR